MSATGIHNPQDRNQKRLYSIKEASTYLGVSAWTVRDLIWKGSIGQVKIGTRLLVDIQELDGFIDANKMRFTY
jgi:excisionase family DNA binding protein